MFKKIAGFFKNFFKHVVSDPMTSLKGVVQLGAAGAAAYGMTRGTVPVNEATIGFAGALAASGIHALGTDATGKETPEAAKVEGVIREAAAVAPVVLSVKDHIEALKGEKEKALSTLATLAEASRLANTDSP